MSFYVYVHRKKTNGEVFYVGKGSNSRCKIKANKSDFWNKIVKKHGYYVDIVVQDIQEWYAFELERELIALYGRRDRGEGSLVNLTDGGEGTSGWIVSDEIKKRVSLRMKGSKHPNASSVIYEVVQVSTGEYHKGTLLYFKENFNLLLFSLIRDKCKSLNGWALRSVFESLGKDVLLNPQSGLRHNSADKNIHSFTNLLSNQTVNMTRFDFANTYKININSMFTKKVGYVVDHWCLTKNKEVAVVNSKFNYTQYKFMKNDEVFEGTRYQFHQQYGINPNKLFVKNRTAKSVHGWSLC